MLLGLLALGLIAPTLGSAQLVQQVKIVGHEGGKARFGLGVAISADGNTALVSAKKVDGAGEGVWVFVRSGTSWTRQAALEVGGEGAGEGCPGEGECEFTGSIALSADGDTAVVGNPLAEGHRGTALVFTRSGSAWSRQAALTPTTETASGNFGRSVALSGDGSTAVVGGPTETHGGAAWLFSRSGSSWGETGKLSEPARHAADRFGRSVAISGDGGTVLVGAPGAEHATGAAWLFSTATSPSEPPVGLTGAGESGKGQFGLGVALSGDGSTALVAARADEAGDGAAWVYARASAGWAQQGPKLTVSAAESGSKVGYAAALSADGSTALLGAPRAGRPHGGAWIFRRSAATWTRSEQLVAGESGTAWFGASAALSQDGRTALVGGIRDHARDGAAWVFQDDSPTPVEPVEPIEPLVKEPVDKGSSGTVLAPTVQLAGSGVLGSTSTKLPAPKLGVSANLTPLSGKVLVKLPGSTHFVALTGALQVPFGTIIDARHGKVSLTTARAGGGTQTATFYAGMFRITQQRNGRVTATLYGGDFSVCPTTAERRHLAHASATHSSRRHTVRKLWAEGHGSYSTKGNYATGAVLGTRWLTEDRCGGTLIRVVTDKVAVKNLVNKRHRTVHAGHSYFAKAPG
ncbi:MAG TPA: hypothetical protein VG366_05935 [Solirubrobacteraceae bacterium]|nr:hypothetical protein [Solirubrobacteraceae bacterium]